VAGRSYRPREELGGMMISRRPKRRASTENAPGPRIMTARSIVMASITVTSEGNRVREQEGINENPTPAAHNPTTMPAKGVKKPTRSSEPAVKPAMPASQVPAEALDSLK
jgi:hypothetical protein